MRGGKGRFRGNRAREGTFDPEDAKHVKHTKLGVWDLYQEKAPNLARIPGATRAELYLEMCQSFPFVWRMLKDIGRIRSCWFMLGIYTSMVVLGSLVPALSLWYSGQLLKIVSPHFIMSCDIYNPQCPIRSK